MRKRIILMVIGALIGLLAPINSANAATDVHWRTGIVYVEDHANSSWPLLSAAENMDDGSGLDFRVVSKCPAGKQCIKVYSVHEIEGAGIGVTAKAISGGYIVGVTTRVENIYGDRVSSRQRLALLCHELGHGVGLPHSTATNTCLSGGIGVNTPTTISTTERKKLDVWY